MSNTLWPAPVQRILVECKIPHELDALKWKAVGRRRRGRLCIEFRYWFVFIFVVKT
jgi:hypothetical protein